MVLPAICLGKLDQKRVKSGFFPQEKGAWTKDNENICENSIN